MQLQRKSNGDGFWLIKEILVKGPMADWLEQEERDIMARARLDIENEVFGEVLWGDNPCPVDCRDDCDNCPKFIDQAEPLTFGWFRRN